MQRLISLITSSLIWNFPCSHFSHKAVEVSLAVEAEVRADRGYIMGSMGESMQEKLFLLRKASRFSIFIFR